MKNEVNLAVKQINGEDDYEESDGEADSDHNDLFDTSKKFGVKTLKPSKRDDARQTGKEIDAEKVLKAARRVTGAADSDEESSDEDTKQPEPVASRKQ